MKRLIGLTVLILFVVSLAGCGGGTSKTTAKDNTQNTAKNILTPPTQIVLYTNGKGDALLYGEKEYKETLDFLNNQLANTTLKATPVKFEDLSPELGIQRNLSIQYDKPVKTTFKMSDGTKNIDVDRIAVVLDGKYKGYVFIAGTLSGTNAKGYEIYEKINTDGYNITSVTNAKAK